MNDFIMHSENLCDSMMKGYINSNYYGKMEDHAIARMERFRKDLTDRQCKEFIENVNYLGNLQLLEATPNEEKNNKDFDEWLKEAFPDAGQLAEYKKKHFIPDVDLSFTNFDEFLAEREALIVEALKKALM